MSISKVNSKLINLKNLILKVGSQSKNGPQKTPRQFYEEQMSGGFCPLLYAGLPLGNLSLDPAEQRRKVTDCMSRLESLITLILLVTKNG